MSFFRYPGGKSKLKNQIISNLISISKNQDIEYREPFFGGGSIGLVMLQQNLNFKNIWINDFDLGISCLWTSLIQFPDLLKSKILNFKPSVENFDKFKIDLTNEAYLCSAEDIVSYGFEKLAIHQMSYSGLGTKSGGPLGGRDQKSQYKIDCRWSPDYICKKIDLLSNLFSSFNIKNSICTNLDFENLIKDDSQKALIYLDPPYFVKGSDLYQHGFSKEDHIRLSNCLKETNHYWLLSYDDCPEIREYYSWANIQEIKDVNYTITALKDKDTGERKSRNKVELLISSKENK